MLKDSTLNTKVEKITNVCVLNIQTRDELCEDISLVPRPYPSFLMFNAEKRVKNIEKLGKGLGTRLCRHLVLSLY